MDTIDQELQRALERLKPRTPDAPASTPTSENDQQQRRLARLNRVMDELFSPFQTLGDPTLEDMLQMARRWCLDMGLEREPRWLALLGTSGAGKTFLIRMCRRFYDRVCALYEHPTTHATLERKVMFVSWGSELARMLEGDYSRIADMMGADFLVLDDIGAEYGRMRELSTSKLFQILSAREHRWTGVTANLSADQIAAQMDVRITSRLIRHGSEVCDVNVPDFNTR